MDKSPYKNPYYLAGLVIGWIIVAILACALIFVCAGLALRAGDWMIGSA